MIPGQINEAVALKLGYKMIEDGVFQKQRPLGGYDEFYRGSDNYSLPDFCRDIAAAWEICEKIKVDTLLSMCWHDGYWHAEIRYSKEGWIDEEADTAPMAICLALLKLDT